MLGRAVVGGVVLILLGLIVAGLTVAYMRRAERIEDKRAGRPVKGDLTPRQERQAVGLLDEGARLLSTVGINSTPAHMEDPEFLRADTRHAIGSWLTSYNAWKEHGGKG